MRFNFFVITGCVSAIALISVVAFAQVAPDEAARESSVPGPPQQIAPDLTPSDPDAIAPDISPVEDAPIDVPANPQSEWAPDINLDAQEEADMDTGTLQPKAKPRKILSDVGENVLGTGSWNAPNNRDAAHAKLLSRESRRARAVDPIKRSDLIKLSRIMGALHALRVSCAGREDQTYRSRMATMLDLEAPDSGALRDPLVDAFNSGFQAYGRGTGACPADARTQEASLAKDGYAVARIMSARYRPPPIVVATLPPASQSRQNVQSVSKAATPKASTAAPAERANWNGTVPN